MADFKKTIATAKAKAAKAEHCMRDSDKLADVLKAAAGREPIDDPPPDDAPEDEDDE